MKLSGGIVIAGLLACSSVAHAGVVQSRYVEDGENSVGAPPADRIITRDIFGCGIEGTGVCSSASHSVSRATRLPSDGPGSPPVDNLVTSADADSTAVAGETVSAFAVLTPISLPIDFVPPMRARTDFFANHVAAGTGLRAFFTSSSEDGAPPLYSSNSSSNGRVSSIWYDTWTANADGTVPIAFRLDGQVRVAGNPCTDGGAVDCLEFFTLPAGTDGFIIKNAFATLSASVTIFDLDTLLPCEAQFGEACDGNQREFERVAAIIGAEVTLDEDGTPFSVDISEALDLEVLAGHRYVAVSSVTARVQDGGVLDFMNTFALTRFDDPLNIIDSQAEREFGARLPRVVPPIGVPAPGSASLFLCAGLGALTVLRRRRVVR